MVSAYQLPNENSLFLDAMESFLHVDAKAIVSTQMKRYHLHLICTRPQIRGPQVFEGWVVVTDTGTTDIYVLTIP